MLYIQNIMTILLVLFLLLPLGNLFSENMF